MSDKDVIGIYILCTSEFSPLYSYGNCLDICVAVSPVMSDMSGAVSSAVMANCWPLPLSITQQRYIHILTLI